MPYFLSLFIIVLSGTFIFISVFPQFFGMGGSYERESFLIKEEKEEIPTKPILPPLNKVEYDRRMEKLANNPPPPIPETIEENSFSEKEKEEVSSELKPELKPESKPKPNLWPPVAPYPKAGAILPFKRVLAYYGNLYSTKMGVLGEYPEEEMLARLEVEVKKWEEADPETPVQPALHYIAVTAQFSPGSDGKHRLRMPGKEIEKVLAMAEKINAIVFLDFQVGFSTLAEELPVFEEYLKLPNVHLGIDPEFSMKGTIRPGKVVGTFDAEDINFAIEYLSRIVAENDLPPKILVVHRYTQKMVTNYQNIKPTEEVQVVMHMDGWGPKAKKVNTYKQFIFPEPVQFAGFKIFYKNDLWDPGTVLFSPEELLKLRPIPIYIQYQ